MYRVRSIWTGSPVSDGLTTLHFDAAEGTPGQAVSAVGAFFTNLTAEINQFQNVTVLGEVELIDEATGLLTDTTSGPDFPVDFTNTNTALPPATQMLLRWGTGVVVAGRRLNGRNFIPGFTEAANVGNGAPDGALVTGVTDAAQALALGDNHQLVVWHRPVDGAGGSKAAVISASVGGQWAILGRRRPQS